MPSAFWFKAVCCNHSWEKQIKYGSIKVVVSNHLEQCSSPKLMPHFYKLTLPVFLSNPPSMPVRFSFEGPTIAHLTNTLEIVLSLGFPHGLDTSVELYLLWVIL